MQVKDALTLMIAFVAFVAGYRALESVTSRLLLYFYYNPIELFLQEGVL